jgi:hypothetical protein
MSKSLIPKIVTFQANKEEFLFLGKDYLLDNPDFGKIWDDFLGTGGTEHGAYDIIRKYGVTPIQNINIWHNNNSNYESFFIGREVVGINEAPKGFTLIKVPASEYFVVTHDFIPKDTNFNFYGEHGNGQLATYIENVQMPNGYIRHGGIYNIILLEISNFHTPNGGRYERWLPIKKT